MLRALSNTISRLRDRINFRGACESRVFRIRSYSEYVRLRDVHLIATRTKRVRCLKWHHESGLVGGGVGRIVTATYRRWRTTCATAAHICPAPATLQVTFAPFCSRTARFGSQHRTLHHFPEATWNCCARPDSVVDNNATIHDTNAATSAWPTATLASEMEVQIRFGNQGLGLGELSSPYSLRLPVFVCKACS